MKESRYYRIAGLVILLTTATSLYGADLHFIALCDTTDASIGTIEDFNNTQSWAGTIADNSGLNLQLQTLSGNDLTIQNAWNILNNLQVDSDDTIYFFYSGHGINVGTSSKWPLLTFDHTSPDPYMSFDNVTQTLEPKGARMLIVIADCCNSYLDDSGRYLPPIMPKQASALEIQNYTRLFAEQDGTVYASSSKPGQASLGSQFDGTLFANMFMSAFASLAQTQADLTWSGVLNKAAQDTQTAATLYGTQQEPQYELDHEEVLAADPPAGIGCGPIGTVPLILGIIGFALIENRHPRPRKRKIR